MDRAKSSPLPPLLCTVSPGVSGVRGIYQSQLPVESEAAQMKYVPAGFPPVSGESCRIPVEGIRKILGQVSMTYHT